MSPVRTPAPTATADRGYLVSGGAPLDGTVSVGGAKNAALPLMAASLLTDEPVTLQRVPRVRDVEVMLAILAHLGTRWRWDDPDTLRLHTPELVSIAPPPALVLKMRASFELLGALLGRAGEAELVMPGGDALGPRPVDQHLKALRAMGASVVERGGTFLATHRNPLRGQVRFDVQTVGGTRNALLAAAAAGEEVVLENASTEPEVLALVDLLRSMGAHIDRLGDATFRLTARRREVRGDRPRLRGACARVIADRIEAGTFMLAAAATRGRVVLDGVVPGHLWAPIGKLAQAGVVIRPLGPGRLEIDARRGPLRPLEVVAREYPGFPTDLQPPLTAFLATVPGESRVRDTVFGEYRFAYLGPLRRFGAELDHAADRVGVRGGPLGAAHAHAPDVRAGAAILIAALAAPGDSVVTGLDHIERGYFDLPRRLRAVGATLIELSSGR